MCLYYRLEDIVMWHLSAQEVLRLVDDNRWTDITGTMRVYANKWNGKTLYSTSLSTGDPVNKEYMFASVRFVKGATPFDDGWKDVDIQRAVMYTYNGKLCVSITDWRIL